MTTRNESLLTRWTYAIGWAAHCIARWDFVIGLSMIQDAVDVQRFERLADRLADDPLAQRLFAEGADLIEYRDAMSRWRAGDPMTLGHQIAAFYEGYAELDADIPDIRWTISPAARRAQLRWRHSHDLRHVLLGVGTTIHEEALVHAFQFAQHWTWMSVFLMPIALVLGTLEGGNPLRTLWHMPRAYRVGRQARLMAFADLEALLEGSIHDAREALGITPVGPAFHGDGPWRPHTITWVEQPDVQVRAA